MIKNAHVKEVERRGACKQQREQTLGWQFQEIFDKRMNVTVTEGGAEGKITADKAAKGTWYKNRRYLGRRKKTEIETPDWAFE